MTGAYSALTLHPTTNSRLFDEAAGFLDEPVELFPSQGQVLRAETRERPVVAMTQGDHLQDFAHLPGQHEPARLAR